MAARNGSQRIEPAGNGAEKALLGLHVCRNRTKQRRLRLVGPVGAAKALDRGVGLPAGLEQVMDAQPAIPRRQFGMVTPPRAAGVGEHEDALDVIHEGRGLGEIGRACAVFDHQPVALADDAARAARHLGDQFGAEALDDLIQCPRYRRQRGKLLDEAVTACDGFPALDRLAVAIDRPGAEVTFRVGEGFVELDREGVGEVVEDILARGDVDLDVAPFFSWNLREPALHQRFARRHDLDDRGVPSLKIVLDRTDQ